jgi:hypothetical protein
MAAPLPAQAGPGQWVPFMLAMWAGGAVIFLVLQWLAYRAFLGRIRETSRPARPALFGGIRTWISNAVDGPLALGVIERRIVLPGDFSRRYNPVERRLALEHELVHHKRGDIWWNLVAMTILAIFWFNPVAWLAFRAFRSDQELACDAAVARTASLDERCDYARALVKSASRPGLIAACALNPAGELKRRLKMMRNHRASRLRSTGGVVALTAFAAAGFAFGSGEGPGPAEASTPFALAPSKVADPAPVEVAAAVPAGPEIVVTGRRHRRSEAAPAAPRLSSEPMSFASAQAPAASDRELASMSRMLRRLPRAIAPNAARREELSTYAFAMPAPPPPPPAPPAHVDYREHRVAQITTSSYSEAHFFVVGQGLSAEQAAEIRRAIAQAAAEGRKVKVRLDRIETAGGGGGGHAFDINIQTLVKGE